MSKKEENNKDQDKGGLSRGGIVPINITKEMEESYLSYAMSVIVSRALPDVRDGLKPVHRRILYAMNELGVTSGSKFKKSAAIVGDVLGKYHPHGDTSVYDAMVKMSQDFSLRYPLVVGQGNFGSIDGDNAAAMRYTEAKMSKLSSELLADIEKKTVNFRDNYDGTRREPIVLPSAVPNLILNGTLGIAVGMATNIPPHNLGEVLDATIHLAENNKATTEDLAAYVKGPDFPIGGIVYNQKDILHAYASGRGGVTVRGEAEIIEQKNGLFQILITSIPYRVNKSNLIISVADLVKNKKLEGIKDIRDESTKDVRIVVDLKSSANPNSVLNYLYKHTELESVFHFNMVALVDDVPQTLSLKSLLDEFLKHRQEVVKRRTEFDLDKALAREHILLGLKKALDDIDAVIKTIKASKDTPEAKNNLMKKFKFSEIQATAILEMKLQKLAGLERKNIENELKEKRELIKRLKDILSSQAKILKVVTDELREIKEKYSDARRTKVVKSGVKNINQEDLIEEKDSFLVFTRGGYVKRTDPGEYKTQKRGGVGVVDLNTKDEDFVSIFLTANTHDSLLFFTDKGKAYQMKMWEVPEGKRSTKGKSIMNYLSLESGEQVNSILAVPKDIKKVKDSSLILTTKKGVVKKTDAMAFSDVRRNGLIAIKLPKDDELLSVSFAEKGDDILMASALGQAIRFHESDVRTMGRTASGVRGMNIKSDDRVIGSRIIKKDVDSDAMLMVIAEKGFGKRTPVSEYKVQKRGGAGIKTAKLTEKTGQLVATRLVHKDQNELIVISKKSQVIRTQLDDIPELGRQTQGVRVMKLRSGDGVVSVICI